MITPSKTPHVAAAPDVPRRWTLRITPADAEPACEHLARVTGLSKSQVKDAMNKGAVRLRRGGRWRMLRRATTALSAGDEVQFHYDPQVLALRSEPAQCIADETRYSVWHKPPGMLAQGNEWGDHCALLRQAEKHFHPPRPAFLVHRLDREAAGLMLIAHDREAAARLSELFAHNRVRKQYRIAVRGNPAPAAPAGRIELPLDGKRAVTSFNVSHYDAGTDVAMLKVTIETGRRHQIRRHFAAIGHPVMGDPAYGRGNKNDAGLQLVACALSFTCPLTGRVRDYRLTDETPAG